MTEPFGKRDLIESRNLHIIRAHLKRHNKRPPSFYVPPIYPIVDLLLKRRKLALVVLARSGVQVKPFVPTTFVKEALLGLAAQKLLFDHNLASGIAAVEQRHFIKKRYQRGVFLKRHRQIMRTPRITHRLAATALCRTADLLFKLK